MTIFVHFGAFWADKPISRPLPFDRLRAARATEYPEEIPSIQQFAQDDNPNALSIGRPATRGFLSGLICVYLATEVAVGMAVARHPPHRSRRALLTHRALALSSGVEADQWIGMTDSSRRYPLGDQALHALPSEVVFLTAPAEHLQPSSANLHVKHPYGCPVHGHAEVA